MLRRIYTIKRYNRKMVEHYSHCLFVFGDNARRIGMGGQAHIRGLPNAFGVATKLSAAEYMSDDDYARNIALISADIWLIERDHRHVIFPEDGIGTGLARLEEKAPLTFQFLNERLMLAFGFNNLNGNLKFNSIQA